MIREKEFNGGPGLGMLLVFLIVPLPQNVRIAGLLEGGLILVLGTCWWYGVGALIRRWANR